MKKNRVKNCIFLLGTALTCLLSGAFSYAHAQAQELPTQTDVLLAPDSYQQYLALESPADVAVSERYTAIADKNVIYVYDAVEEYYRQYVHDYYLADPASNTISKLQFDAEGNLYFSDRHNLFILPFEDLTSAQTLTATDANFSCTTFLVVNDTLYFTKATTGNTPLYETTIQEMIPQSRNITTIVDTGLNGIPALAYYDNALYFTSSFGYSTLYKLNLDTQIQRPISSLLDLKIADLGPSITSIAVQKNVLALTTENKEFYTYELPRAEEDTLLYQTSGEFSALYAFHDYIYAVNGSSIWQYDLSAGAFTDFEICANSARENRLSGATDVLQVGDRLFISDAGNARISVFSTKDNAFITTFNATLPITYLSSDGTVLCAANAEKVALYSLNEDALGQELGTFDGFSDPIVGVASVYGKHYFATAMHAYQITFDETQQAFVYTVTEKTDFHPALLSADVYGNIYTYKSGQLLRFTEEEFMSRDKTGTQIAAVSYAGIHKITHDYEGDAYALTDNAVYKLTGGAESYSFSAPYVYTSTTRATSFTLDVEENAGYLLMDGNHLVKTEKLLLPTVKTIAVQDADAQIFSTQSADVKVVQVQEKALLVCFDLTKTNGAEFFPYLSYSRSGAPLTALQLGETDGYALIAVFDTDANDYFTYLVKKQFCQTPDQSEYHVSYATPKTAWLTNAVRLYKFPYLTQLLTVESLPRGAKVTLLGEINELDHDYYLVEYVNADGETVRGYIPKPYCSPFDAAPTPPTQTVIGEEKSALDTIMRMVYILLGFAIICILVDFLLLRTPHEDEEE